MEPKTKWCETHKRAFECIQRAALKGAPKTSGRSSRDADNDPDDSNLSSDVVSFYKIFGRGRDPGDITLQIRAPKG